MEEHTFTSGDKQTFYLATGPKDGPLIIFIHGWPAIGLTWKPQLEAFASLGFRAVAPDMPGYGGSTHRKVVEDYSQREINLGMLALLKHLGREKAVWIGHDWGAPAVWTMAQHYPERVLAVAGLAVPALSLEIGLEHTITTVNRDLYPEDKYPYGQWSYQAYYEKDFEAATAFFDKDPGAFLRAAYTKGNPESAGKPAEMTSTVVRDGGWAGGAERPDPAWRDHVPVEARCIDEDTYQKLTAAMEKTGFWGADAWYFNHQRNKAYFEEWKMKNGGYEMRMPALFIGAAYDVVCDTERSTLAALQREHCTNLTEAKILGGHWLPQEKPEETNAVIARWIVEVVPEYWPTAWTRTASKSVK